jgi:uncharacterized protein YccT (UPF0319 family)
MLANQLKMARVIGPLQWVLSTRAFPCTIQQKNDMDLLKVNGQVIYLYNIRNQREIKT